MIESEINVGRHQPDFILRIPINPEMLEMIR